MAESPGLNIETLLIELNRQVGFLSAQVQELTRRHDDADRSRAGLHRQMTTALLAVGGATKDIAEVRDDINHLTQNLAVFSTRLQAIELAKEIVGARLEGATWTTRILWAAVVGGIAALVWLWEHLGAWLTKK